MADKSFKRGLDPKEAMDIGISRDRKLLLKKITYYCKLIALEQAFNIENLTNESIEDYANENYAVGDKKPKEIKFSNDEGNWIWNELRRLDEYFKCANDEYFETMDELELIKNEQIERINKRSRKI